MEGPPEPDVEPDYAQQMRDAFDVAQVRAAWKHETVAVTMSSSTYILGLAAAVGDQKVDDVLHNIFR